MTKEEREDDEGKAFVIPAHAGIRWRVVIRHVRAGEHPLEECKQILAFARMTRERLSSFPRMRESAGG